MSKKGKTSEAIVVEENIQLLLYNNNLAKEALDGDKIKNAIDYLKKAIYYGEKGNGLIMLLHLLVENKKYDEVIKYANYAISLDSNNGKAMYFKGIAFFNKKKYRNAIQCLKETLHVGGHLTHEQILFTNYYAGISYYYLERYSLALTYFDRIQRMQPTFEDSVSWIEKTKKKMR